MIADLSAPYRRTRRTRAVPRRLAIAVALALFLVVFLAGAVRGGTAGGGVDRVTVRPGDTIWSIAAERSDGGDVRTLVDHIMAANGRHSATLVPGEELLVPPQ